MDMKLSSNTLAYSAAVLALLFAVPLSAFAAAGDFAGVSTLLTNVTTFINNILVPLIFALAFLVFIYGVFQFFIAGAADEGKRDNGKQLMLYGLIGFVVMVSLWGIVNLLAQGLGLQEEQVKDLPNVLDGGQLKNN